MAAIATQNETRRLLTELNELRLPAEPKLTGSEALEIHIASQVTPAEVFQPIARDLLGHLRDRDGLDTERARLVLIGAELDEPEYVEVLESQGALVVADRLCWGARSVLEPIDEDAPDPMEALARANFFRPSCARMMGDFPLRFEDVMAQLDELQVDGVVFQRLTFCDPWGGEAHHLAVRLRSAGVPFLQLEREYGTSAVGQVRTRVQAFVEQIAAARRRDRA